MVLWVLQPIEFLIMILLGLLLSFLFNSVGACITSLNCITSNTNSCPLLEIFHNTDRLEVKSTVHTPPSLPALPIPKSLFAFVSFNSQQRYKVGTVVILILQFKSSPGNVIFLKTTQLGGFYEDS